jgi:hypothetical protein
MDDEDALDEQALIERIRQRINGPLAAAPFPPPAPRPAGCVEISPEVLDAELAAMAQACDVGDIARSSYRKLIGPMLNAARRTLQRLLARPLELQTNYNLANYRLVRAYQRELESLRRDYEALRRRCDEMETSLRRFSPADGRE